MDANPLLGVFFHWLGGLSSASFYVPYKRIRRWSWEIFWITGGVFSWVIAPWVFASLQTNELLDGARRDAVEDAVLVLVLGRDVGPRRAHVRV